MLTSRLILLTVFLISACSAPVRAVTDYIQFKQGSRVSAIAKSPLNPAYKYLLVTVDGKSFLMARGAIESSSDGPVEVWYSGNREVLKIQNGRIISATGTPVEWSNVLLSGQPEWSKVSSVTTMKRRRDVMPGYHFGITDSLSIFPVVTPSHSAFYGPMPSDVHWFKETYAGPEALPASRYAVRIIGSSTEVIYSEQCLSKSLCFSWQRWPTQS
jgi:hypothetical protein